MRCAALRPRRRGGCRSSRRAFNTVFRVDAADGSDATRCASARRLRIHAERLRGPRGGMDGRDFAELPTLATCGVIESCGGSVVDWVLGRRSRSSLLRTVRLGRRPTARADAPGSRPEGGRRDRAATRSRARGTCRRGSFTRPRDAGHGRFTRPRSPPGLVHASADVSAQQIHAPAGRAAGTAG